MDSRRLAKRTLGLSATALLVGGVLAMVLRLQLMDPEASFAVGPDFVGVLTLHASTMLFVGLLPFGLAMHLAGEGERPVARGLGFAVAAMAAGGLVMQGGLFLGGDGLLDALPRGGWAGDPSLRSGGPGTDAWALGLALVGSGLWLAAVATISRARGSVDAASGPGDSGRALELERAGWLAAAGVLVCVVPVLLAGLGVLLADRHLGTALLDVSGTSGLAASPGIWERAIWPRGNPLLVAAVLPGLAASVASFASAARARLAARALFGAAAASVVLWLVHAVAPGAGPALTVLRLVVAAALAVALGSAFAARPVGPHDPADPAARAFARGSLFFLALALVGGVLELGSDARGTGQATVAHLHFALVGAGLCGLAAGLYRAWPRLFGRSLDADWGRAHAWVFVATALGAFGSLDALAALGMPRRVSGFAAGGAAEAWTMIASVASFALGGAFGFFALVVGMSRRGRPAR